MTPKHVSGRLVGTFLMLYGIGFLTVAIAAITSTFVARAEREHQLEDREKIEAPEARIEARIDALGEQIARLEALLSRPPD